MRRSSLAIIFLIVVANFTVFALLNRPVDPPAWEGKIAGVSFAPYRAGQGPIEKIYPSEAEIRAGMSGNLCRCTGYQNIVKAVQYAAAKLQQTQQVAA